MFHVNLKRKIKNQTRQTRQLIMESQTKPKDFLNQQNGQTWGLLLPFNYDLLATGQEPKSYPTIKIAFIQLEIHRMSQSKYNKQTFRM